MQKIHALGLFESSLLLSAWLPVRISCVYLVCIRRRGRVAAGGYDVLGHAWVSARRKIAAARRSGFHLLRRRRALTGLVVRLHLRELICHRNRLLSGGRLLRRRPWLLLLLLLRLVLPVAAAVASDGSYSAFDLPRRRFLSQPPEERWRLIIYIFNRINCSFTNKKFKKTNVSNAY